MHHDPDADDVVPNPEANVSGNTPASTSLTADSVLEAIDQLADGYCEMDTGYRYRRVNPAGLRITGKTRGEMLGKHVLEVFPEITNAAIHQTTIRVMETGEAASVETFYPPFNRRYVNSIYLITGGIALCTRDINDQKVQEHNLAFLAEASKILSSSLDTQQTLRAVAQVAVPRIGDWCAIDVLTGPRTVELLAVAHVDPGKVQWAEELRQQAAESFATASRQPSAG